MKDAGGFEGNAQTLRILTCLEKKTTDEFPPTRAIAHNQDIRRGLGITYRGLASILKYDNPIPVLEKNRKYKGLDISEKPPVKGYYEAEEPLVQKIKAKIARGYSGKFKTIECSIMDVADDIAYSTYDIEDAFAANFLTPISILSVSDDQKQTIVNRIQNKIDAEFSDLPLADRQFNLESLNDGLENIFASVIKIDDSVFSGQWTGERLGAAVGSDVFRRSLEIAKSSYARTQFTSDLIGKFIHEVQIVESDSDPVFWNVRPSIEAFMVIETLKSISYSELINSDKFLADRARAEHIITRIFKALRDKGSALMTNDWRMLYAHYEDDDNQQQRAICDFIMTNRYCIEFYERLFGVRPPSIHKP